jgi:uncharacterized protein (TIGR02145 family)
MAVIVAQYGHHYLVGIKTLGQSPKFSYMKKTLIPLVAMLLFGSCQKEDYQPMVSDDISSAAATSKQGKLEVCHYDAQTGTSHTIRINANALAAHLKHGDVLGDCASAIVNFCGKDWTKRNLDVTTYRNGDPIPQVTDPEEWKQLRTGAWCYYNNDPANGAIYGKLYNWYAVTDPRGLAPRGWHVPSNTEWQAMRLCVRDLPPKGYVGGKMKTTGTIEDGTGLWYAPNTAATNLSGFTGLPGGLRYSDGDFRSMGFVSGWWGPVSSPYAGSRPGLPVSEVDYLGYNIDYIFPELFSANALGHYVRCIRN